MEFLKRSVQLKQPNLPIFSRVEMEQNIAYLEIQEMLGKEAGTVEKPSVYQYISSLFLVPKNDWENRPVVNLGVLNGFLSYAHFKMEILFMLNDLLMKGD